MNQNPMFFLMSMLSGGNPQAHVQQIMQSNPQAQAIVTQMKQSGMTPKQFLNQYARQNNIDLTPMINLLGQNGIRI